MTVKKFTMDSVLKFRKQQEDILTQRFLKAQLKENKTRSHLQSLSDSYDHLVVALAKEQTNGITASDLARYDQRSSYLDQQITITENELTRRKKTVFQAKKRLLAKSKEHKALKTLKEKQDNAWKAYLDKKEAIMLDEIAVLRHEKIHQENG